MRVLVVEDDARLRDLWAAVVEGAGAEATAVSAAVAARKLLLTTPFDLVLLDLNLGGDTGLSVATLAGYSNPDCQVIVITGSPLFARGELFAMDPSIVSVMRKPVDLRELSAMCEHHADRVTSGRSGAPRRAGALAAEAIRGTVASRA